MIFLIICSMERAEPPSLEFGNMAKLHSEVYFRRLASFPSKSVTTSSVSFLVLPHYFLLGCGGQKSKGEMQSGENRNICRRTHVTRAPSHPLPSQNFALKKQRGSVINAQASAGARSGFTRSQELRKCEPIFLTSLHLLSSSVKSSKTTNLPGQ